MLCLSFIVLISAAPIYQLLQPYLHSLGTFDTVFERPLVLG